MPLPINSRLFAGPATLQQSRPGIEAAKKSQKQIHESPAATKLNGPNFELVSWVEIKGAAVAVKKVSKMEGVASPTLACDITSKTNEVFTVHIECERFLQALNHRDFASAFGDVQVHLEIDGKDMGAQITDFANRSTRLPFLGLQVNDDTVRAFRFKKPMLVEDGVVPPEEALERLGTIRLSCRRARWMSHINPVDAMPKGNIHDELDEKARKGKLAHLSNLDAPTKAIAPKVTVTVQCHPEDDEHAMQVFLFRYNSRGILEACNKRYLDSFKTGPGSQGEPIEVQDSDDEQSDIDDGEVAAYIAG